MAKELPILFTAEMVRAKREGRKSVFRRVCKIDNPGFYRDAILVANGAYRFNGYGTADFKFLKPRYQVGDHLWIKEKWRINSVGCVCREHNANHIIEIEYATMPGDSGSDTKQVCGTPEQLAMARRYYHKHKENRYGSSRFMPKFAARLWREVVSVRPERLWDITDEDAIREGILKFEYGTEYDKDYGGRENNMAYSVGFGTKRLALSVMPNTARYGFRRLWDKINAKPKPVYATIDGKKQIIEYVSYPWENVRDER